MGWESRSDEVTHELDRDEVRKEASLVSDSVVAFNVIVTKEERERKNYHSHTLFFFHG